MLGILSLIYCSPLLIAGGRTFVVPQNFAQPSSDSHSSAPITTIGQRKPNHMRWFIERLLERTRPPRAVCQLAVAYLVSLSGAVQNELRAAAESRLRYAATHHPLAIPMSTPVPVPMMAPGTVTPTDSHPPPYSAEPPASMPASVTIGMPPVHLGLAHVHNASAPVSALLDPRRVLLAAMVLAHKFHLDKTWTNKAWAKVSGLEPREVGRCERQVAIALGHRLWAGRV